MSTGEEPDRRELLRAIVLLEISVELIEENKAQISLDQTDFVARIDQVSARLESILETVTKDASIITWR